MLLSVDTTTLVIASFLALVSLVQPAAERLRLPYAVLLALVGLAVGGVSSFLFYSPSITVFDDLVGPIVNLPFGASIFLDVFLPVLLFHASLTIDLREVAEDAAPILVLAIVAVVAAAAAIGFGLALAGVPLIVALLLGSIVATTDPAAVVAILHEVGAPPRLTRLLEGESLLNDAAAIVLFTVLTEMLATGGEPHIAAGAAHFAVSFAGGIVLGVVGGRLWGMLLPLLGGSRMAEVTLAVALPYIVYLIGEKLDISGVVAVASAGLTAGTIARVRLGPENWEYLERVWEQMGFWASSLIFITASADIPRLLGGHNPGDLWLLLIALAAALLSRAAVLFGLFPLLSALGLSQKVSAAYNFAIAWGGLRGAVTLALALSVTENKSIAPEMKDLVAALATGFVLFTLLVNGLTLRPLMRLLGLDRLSPLDQALRDKVRVLSLTEVREAVRDTAREYAISPTATKAATERYEAAIDELKTDEAELDSAISDGDRITIGLVALANQERRLIHGHQTQHTVSGPAFERLLRNTNTILDAAKAEGQEGYERAARAALAFPRAFQIASFLHRRLGIQGPLQREISIRFETLLVRRLVLGGLGRLAGRRLRTLLGETTAERLNAIVAGRAEATASALNALRLQYPDHADALERRFLQQSGQRLLIARYHDLRAEGLIGPEVFDDLGREHEAGQRRAANPPLDLGLRTEVLIAQFEMFAGLGDAAIKALARRFRPRLLVPDEVIMRKGERGNEMFLISSGAVEVVLPDARVRLGTGEFFGEMALLGNRRRQADVVALGYCRVLVLSAADLQHFLREFPAAKAEIDRVAAARREENMARAAAGG
ncbi:MAG TPA: cation:proton antiporter [Stellaceae bacterium]|nr:cation:proton antiporter [Stellaceae bacterium]